MDTNGHQRRGRIRASLSHPILDADGHWLEVGPVLSGELRRIGGDAACFNAVGNSAFFEGTAVAKDAAARLAETPAGVGRR